MSRAIKLYRHPLSAHAHRVELLLSLLGKPTELVFVDLSNLRAWLARIEALPGFVPMQRSAVGLQAR